MLPERLLFVSGMAALGFVTGCSGDVAAMHGIEGAAVKSQMRGPFTSTVRAAVSRSEKGGSVVAISDSENEVIDIFTASGKQIGELTGFGEPAGLASDVKGNLYVADFGAGTIDIFAAGLQGQPEVVEDPGELPLAVDSFENGAYLGVTQISSKYKRGSVAVFKGSTLLNTISDASLNYAYYCAFDASGNLYVDGIGPQVQIVVGVIPKAASGGTKFEQLTTGNQLISPGGMQITPSGRIAILDFDAKKIYTYNPPKDGSLGAPVRTTPLGDSSAPNSFAFTNGITDFFEADQLGNAQKYAYPKGHKPLLSIPMGGRPYGAAVIPKASR